MSKKRILHIFKVQTIRGVLVGLVLTIALTGAVPWATYAQACGVQLFGLCENEGYFLGGTVTAAGVGLLTAYGGYLGSNDTEAFIGQTFLFLQGFNCNSAGGGDAGHMRNAAAFVVLTMLGFPPGTPANHACTVFGTWANRVREYSAAGLINFNANFSYVFNTRMQVSTLDVAWYGAADTRLSIVIRAPDGHVIYAIKKDCGNPVAGAAGFGILLPLATPPGLNCANTSFSTTPANPSASENFTISVGFNASSSGTGGGGTNYSIFVNLPGTDPSQPAVNGAGPPTGGVAAFAQPTSHNSPVGSGTLPNASRPQPIRFLTTGQKNGTFSVAVGGASPGTIVCPMTVNVVSKPYFRAYGGDVMAGAGFGDSCAPHWAAIIGWNRAVAPYTGSGSQLATFALNSIIDYTSGAPDGAQPPGNAQWTNPKRLAFANSGTGESGGGVPGTVATAPGSTYGGGFYRGNIVCAADYYGARPASAVNLPGAGVQVFSVDAAAQGVYSRNGDLAIQGNGIVGGVADDGNELTIYVNGNVYIETPITYRDVASYTSVTDIPTFRLIVNGNIFVHPDVEQLDGIYVAQQRAGTDDTGFFYTCGNRAWAGGVPAAADLGRGGTGSGAGCLGRRLHVYGAVVAETVKLLRTIGTVSQASTGEHFGANNTVANPGNPAEEFIFSPEMWFGSVNSGDGDYDAVTSLPPVL